MPTEEQKYIFTYKGIDYDASSYASKHPGGIQFLQKMKVQRKDITEYFKSIHSDGAEKILTSFRQVGKSEMTKQTRRYLKLYESVKHLYQPSWFKEISCFLITTALFLVACFARNPYVSMLGFAVSQVVSGWLAHSMNHSRDPKLQTLGNVAGAFVGGLSGSWWSHKHNMHHTLKICKKNEEQMEQRYCTAVYPFLYIKWRLESLHFCIATFNISSLLPIIINYFLIYKQRIIYFLVGIMVGGFYSMHLFAGYYQTQTNKQDIHDDFISLQLARSHNYPYQGFFWLICMGGMQYQTEHNLFPQIPFYNLPKAKIIIAEELKAMGKEVVYATIF